MCGGRAARTVLIAVAGVMLVKDLCADHLLTLLEGAREPPSAE
jgi:hypothetical protein